jgi:ABC-2 type transport system ATP-binding protein
VSAAGAGAAARAIEVEGLVKSYGARRAVDGLSLSVERGQILALLGPNGAGKTTTVEILEGYRRPDAGRVRVLGLDPWTEAAALKPRLGLMLQQGGVYPAAYPLEMLRLLASFYRRPRDPQELLARVGLTGSARTRFRRLSGGQKQRLLLALALVGRPEVLFLDEPTAAMDPQARRATWELILEERAAGTTIVLTTHFMEEAERLADRVAIVDQGRLVALDSPRALREAGLDGRPTLSFRTRAGLDRTALAAALGAERVDEPEAGRYQAWAHPTPADVERLASYLKQQDALLEQFRIGHQTLEELFLALTGHGLRE